MKKDVNALVNEVSIKPRQKRARKNTLPEVPSEHLVQNPNIQLVIEDNEAPTTSIHLEMPVQNIIEVNPRLNTPSASLTDLRKRGRKPKGGKMIVRSVDTIETASAVTNVILHLKCSLKDLNEYNQEQSKMMTDPLNYNSEIPPNIMTYNGVSKSGFSTYDTENPQKNTNESNFAYLDNSTFSLPNGQKDQPNNLLNITAPAGAGESESAIVSSKEEDDFDMCKDDPSVSMKDIHAKLKRLKISLYKNSLHEKKSSCFWCTYDFDNQACYIPKYEMDGEICAYGSFCRPECAVAYLMKENVDDSTKFERYHLLNQLYGRIYQFKENIKPAPNPYYLLDKYYGNLTIQEYRKLLNTEHMLLVIDKPLTRILPELHEDTDDFIVGIYGGNKGASTQAGGVYKVKRQSEKQQGPSKSSIIRGKFGLTQ